MRHASQVRMELGIPTVFNLLGPLSHPASLTRQVIGVPVEETAKRMAEVLQATGTELAMVVTGDGGLDELSITGPNTILPSLVIMLLPRRYLQKMLVLTGQLKKKITEAMLKQMPRLKSLMASQAPSEISSH